LPVLRLNAPLNESVAVSARRNVFETARLPIKLSVAVKPASRYFFVSAAVDVSVAVSDLATLRLNVATSANVAAKTFPVLRLINPAKDRVALNARTNKRETAKLPINDKLAVKPWLNICGGSRSVITWGGGTRRAIVRVG